MSILFLDIFTWQKKEMFCKPKCNKDFTLDKWIAQEPDLKPLHLDSPVVIVLEFGKYCQTNTPTTLVQPPLQRPRSRSGRT